MGKLRGYIHNEEGQGTVEYVIILALVAILVVSILSILGPAVGDVFSRISIALQDPQNYTELIATYEAEIAATQDAEIITTVEAEPISILGVSPIASVSAKRAGDSLNVYVVVSKPTTLAVATSDGRSISKRCVQSCVVTISEVNSSSGTVTVTPTEGNSVSAKYPSKVVSEVLQPENVATIAGATSSLALVLYFGKNLWWKVGLKVVSQCAASGKTEAALKIFQRVATGGEISPARASGVWNLLKGPLAKHISPSDLFSFYNKIGDGVAKLLPPVVRVEYFTELGRLLSELGSFQDALQTLRTAEEMFHLEGIEGVSRAVQTALHSGLGTTYVYTYDDITNLKKGHRYLNMAQDDLPMIDDHKKSKTIQQEIDSGREKIGLKLPQAREREKTWGGATIDDCEENGSLYVGKEYTLIVSMGWGEVPTATQGAAFKGFHVPQTFEPFVFDVAVWAKGMDVCAENTDFESLWIRALELDPASELPTRVQFKLVPKNTGKKLIRVDFYYKLHWLQEVMFQVEVIDPTSTVVQKSEGELTDTQPLQVGMLLGLGGRGDKSFNDSAYQGLESARKLYGIEFEIANSGTSRDSLSILQQWAKTDYDLIIAVGYHNRFAVAQAAKAYPDQHFAIIDTEVTGENVWSAVFREYEVDYVVGALAGLVVGEGAHVGFIGGVRTPIINRIESAFSQGLKDVNPDALLNTVYVNRFDDEIMGRHLAEVLYTNGIEVIYQAAGRSGVGAIQAAKKLGKLIISTGGDHSELAPDVVLTSRIKNVYRPVLDVVKTVSKDKFQGGQTVSYGLADGGLLLTPIRPEVVKRLSEMLSPDISLQDLGKRIQKIQETVTNGQISIDLDEFEKASIASAGDSSLTGGSLDYDDSEHLVIGWELLLVAAMEVGLELLAEGGVGDNVRELRMQLAHYPTKIHWTACRHALDIAVQDIGEERMRLLLNHQSFRQAIITGLLDPMQGFDLQAAAGDWGNQLSILSPILRRFFSVLENALLTNETFGMILKAYRNLWCRPDTQEAMRKMRLDIPSQELVSVVEEQLIASGAVVPNGEVDTDTDNLTISENVLANVVRLAFEQLVTEPKEIITSDSCLTKMYLLAHIEGCDSTDPLHLGKEYQLQVGVSRIPIEGFKSVNFSLLSGDPVLEFKVSVQSADMDVVIDPSDFQRFIWQRKYKKPELLEFTLTPSAVGSKEIRVEFHWRQHALTQIKFDVNVIAAKRPRVATIGQLPPLEYQDYPLDINLRIVSEGKLYRAEIGAVGRRQRVPIEMSPHELAALSKEFREEMDFIVNKSGEGEERTVTNSQDSLRSLAEIGYYTFKMIFGHHNAQELLDIGQIVSLQVSSEDFFLPWEWVYPISPDESLSYEHFWGMNCIISRIIDAPYVSPIISIAHRPKLGLLTYGNLPSVMETATPYFNRLADDGKIALSCLRALNPEEKQGEFREFRRFWKQAPDLAHFACHAFYEDDSPSLSYILLSDEFPITLRDLKTYEISMENSHPLVILNACETGNLNPLYTSHFAAAFLEYGARGVVATECAVPDDFAADFAQQLYKHLLAGKPLGQSLLATRRYFLEEHNNPSGLLYSMYAPPSIRLAQKGD